MAHYALLLGNAKPRVLDFAHNGMWGSEVGISSRRALSAVDWVSRTRRESNWNTMVSPDLLTVKACVSYLYHPPPYYRSRILRYAVLWGFPLVDHASHLSWTMLDAAELARDQTRSATTRSTVYPPDHRQVQHFPPGTGGLKRTLLVSRPNVLNHSGFSCRHEAVSLPLPQYHAVVCVQVPGLI
ncbi:hypothetical protein BD413DRAFT_77031 [Trametes elegans]|nr:hypothetical protein BD413DRAFT_77031 [Trametes elegans]